MVVTKIPCKVLRKIMLYPSKDGLEISISLFLNSPFLFPIASSMLNVKVSAISQKEPLSSVTAKPACTLRTNPEDIETISSMAICFI